MSTPGPWGRPSRRKPSRLGLYLWLGVMALTALLIYVLRQYFPSGDSPFSDPNQIQLLGFLALASSGLLFVRQVNMSRTIRNVLIWVAVGGVVIIGFSYQHELEDLGLRLRSKSGARLSGQHRPARNGSLRGRRRQLPCLWHGQRPAGAIPD